MVSRSPNSVFSFNFSLFFIFVLFCLAFYCLFHPSFTLFLFTDKLFFSSFSSTFLFTVCLSLLFYCFFPWFPFHYFCLSSMSSLLATFFSLLFLFIYFSLYFKVFSTDLFVYLRVYFSLFSSLHFLSCTFTIPPCYLC